MAEIRNPNIQGQGPGSSGGGGGGDMRSMMAVMLVVVLVLFGYQYFFKPKPATPPPTQQQQQTQSVPAVPSPAGQSGGDAASAASSPQAPTAAPTVAAAAEKPITIENELYKIVFTNKGAQVQHWILKKYKDTAGQPLDMVQPQAAAQFGLPLSLFTYEPALTTQLNSVLYQTTVAGQATGAGAQPSASGSVLAPTELSFHYAGGGLDVVKTIRFDATYTIDIETHVLRNGSPVRALVQWPAGLGDMEEFLPASATRSGIITPSFFAYSSDGKQNTQGPTAGGFLFWTSPGVSNNETLIQPYDYAGIADLYFAAVFMPDVPARTSVVTLHNAIDVPSDQSNPNSAKRPAQVLGVGVGDTSGYTHERLFAGPKSLEVLAATHATGADGKPDGQSLQPLIQFGWMTILATPLYWVLRFLNEHGVPNWGWDIILVTIVFNLLMLPTRLMMMKQSLKMSRLQPKVDAIKRKYANLKVSDPKRAEMNTEMMALYKTENVNMYGGCLPLLIQMPLFFAYYRVLANVIELRQAHWFWLHDLSVADPLHILPIIIIISMFLVQFMTPSPGMDPNQRRMMAVMMPVIFGFSMWHFASGLALYWGTGNLINLGIQLAINRSKMGQEMHAIAAKRQARKLGNSGGKGGQTIQGKR